MRALVKTRHGPGGLELQDKEKPKYDDDEVLVRVESAAICGSDVERYTGKNTIYRPPVTLGHEISGVIAEVGRNAKGWQAGMRIIVEANVHACGRCEYCRKGSENLCSQRVGIGYDVDGGFADFVRVPASMLIPLPDNVSFDLGSLTDFYVAVHAVVDRSSVKAGNSVVIIGPGFLGLSILQLCRLQGADPIIVVGQKKDSERLQIARSFSATKSIVSEESDVKKEVIEITEGLGADTAFEVSGSKEGLCTAIKSVRPGGEVTMVGILPQTVDAPLQDVILRQISLNGIRAYTWQNCMLGMRYLGEGKIQLDRFITHRFPLESWQEAFDLLVEGKATKIILKP